VQQLFLKNTPSTANHRDSSDDTHVDTRVQ